MITRVSRELERPCRLHRDCRMEPRLTNCGSPGWATTPGDPAQVITETRITAEHRLTSAFGESMGSAWT